MESDQPQDRSTLDLINDHFKAQAMRQAEGRRPANLLIIDDEKPFTELLDRSLSKVGVKVTCANDGQTALEILISEYERLKAVQDERAHRPFDLILLDLKMPTMTGVEVLKQIKAKLPDVLIVICTGYPKSEDIAQALKIGFLGMIEKPLDITKLIEIFRACHIDAKLKF